MKSANILHKVTIIVGIIISACLFLLFGTKIIGSFFGKGGEQLTLTYHSMIDWYDNPIGFFISYLIGYILVWWKPLLGAIIIIAVSCIATLVNIDNPGWLIFTLPTLLVGILYLSYWFSR